MVMPETHYARTERRREILMCAFARAMGFPNSDPDTHPTIQAGGAVEVLRRLSFSVIEYTRFTDERQTTIAWSINIDVHNGNGSIGFQTNGDHDAAGLFLVKVLLHTADL